MGPRILIDGGSENKSVAEAVVRSYRVRRTFALSYHPQSNGPVKRGHDPIVNSLSKDCSKQPEKGA